jgi:hypothetical protein
MVCFSTSVNSSKSPTLYTLLKSFDRWSAAKNKVLAKKEIMTVVDVFNLLRKDAENILGMSAKDEKMPSAFSDNQFQSGIYIYFDFLHCFSNVHKADRVSFTLKLNALCSMLLENEINRLWTWSFPGTYPDPSLLGKKTVCTSH